MPLCLAADVRDNRPAPRAWLNPSDLVDIAPEVTPTAASGEEPCRYPDRVLAKNAEAAAKL